MDFRTDISSLKAPSNRTFELVGTLPTNIDVYFRAKQKEIIDQYAAARIFMRETDTDDWGHWFFEVNDEDANTAFKLTFIAYFYEVALIYYNIVVDLSWVICYVAAEFACSQKGQRVDFSGMKTIEDAAELLRKAENNVTAPTAENNPFNYLKTMNPDFSNAIDLIIDFWNNFSSTPIRSRYNFCKHKGKPAYSEIEILRGGRIMEIHVGQKATGETSQIASDIRDVQHQFSLLDGIKQLHQFDDEVLFPYIKDLLNELEKIIQPSLVV